MKMSDYILEQDISSASVMDIEIQQAYAEMAVASALMDCYLKQATIMEYASCDASEFGVFVESDDSTSKESKGFINTIKNAWNKFINWIKSTFKALVMAIAKKSPEKTLYYLEKCPDDATFKLSAPVVNNIQSFSHLYDVLNQLLEVLESGPEQGTAAKCQKIIDKVDSWYKPDENGKSENSGEDTAVYAKGTLARILKRMNDQDPVKKTKDLYAQLEKRLKTDGKDNAEAKVSKDDMERVKEAVDKSGRAIVDLSKSLNAIFDEVVRKTYKESKKKD